MWLFKPLSTHTSAMSPALAIAPYGLCVARFRYRSIRALCRPLSLSLHTGSVSPYFAIAPYGLCVALFRYRSMRAPATAIACGNTPPRLRYCLGGNTRNWRGYVLGLAPLRAYAALSLVPLHPRPRMLSSCSMFCVAGDIGGGGE